MTRDEILQLAHSCALLSNVGTDLAVLRFAQALGVQITEQPELSSLILPEETGYWRKAK